MAEGAPNSSWHPAMMPNSPSKQEQQKKAAVPHIDSALHTNAEDEVNTPTIPDATHSHDFGDAWMSGDGDEDEADAWLMSEEPTLQSIDVSPAKPAAPVQTDPEPASKAAPAPSFDVPEPVAEALETRAPAHDSLETKPTATDPFDTHQDDGADSWFTEEPALEPAAALEAEPQHTTAIDSTPAATEEPEPTKPAVELQPETVPAPAPEPELVPAPKAETEAELEVLAEPEVKAKPTVESAPWFEEVHKVEAESAGATEPAVEAAPWLEEEPEIEAEPVVATEPVIEAPLVAAEPVVEVEPVIEAAPWAEEEPEVEASPKLETEPAVEAQQPEEPKFELQGQPEPVPAQRGFDAEPDVEAEQEVEPQHQPLSQHSSSMSFARTVSHEISFDGDDDSEWTLSRSDTDPFNKFMSPTDRTNSFPAVPPPRHQDDAFPSHPLPTQALEVVEETERASFTNEDPEDGKMFWENDGPAQTTQDSFQTIGGDIGDEATEASQSRFEEGLPLIPAAADTSEQTKKTTFDGFGDDDNDDDFFSQVKQDEPEDDFIQPVQRKSTMQVIGNSLDRQATMQQPGFDTLDEHAEEEHHAQALADAFGAAAKDETQVPTAVPEPDLSSKWQEAFGTGDDDDDFLLDDAGEGENIDAAGFLGSDDEGLLLDEDDELLDSTPASAPVTAPATNPYLPTQAQTQPAPVTAPATSYGYAPQPPQQTPYGGAFGYAPAALPKADAPKAESFASKAKGGYSSPYDLPTDLVSSNVKPRKRPSLPQQTQEPAPPPTAAPPRAANPYAPVPGSTASAPPAASAPVSQPPRSASRQESFFEDLPMAAKPRPASRQSARAASPSKQYSPTETSTPPPPPMNQQYQPASSPIEAPAAPQNSVPNLVAPPKVNPYASLQAGSAQSPAPAPNATRYSPAPAQQAKGGSAPPPAASNRFSPAPPLPRQNSSPPQTISASASQTYLPHLPRTSSPLAQFEIHHDKSGAAADGSHLDRRASSNFEPRLNRVASLPPTREVDEEDEEQAGHQLKAPQQPSSAAGRYSPAPQQTPSAPASQMPSPQKRHISNYLPQSAPNQPNFAPPVRSQTQSPGASRNSYQPARPSSAHTSAAPGFGQTGQPTNTMPVRTRGASITMDMVPPTDGRELDPLQRWQGVPIISWGVGGAMVTSFPKSTPRYTMNQSVPTMLRTPGEVKVKSMKEIEPLPEHLAKFPGPLRGKSKKKDALAWLASGIASLEKELPDISLSAQLSLEAKRSIERLLLWKILRVFIEFDGHLEGSPAVEKAVREILSPQTAGDAPMPNVSSFNNQSVSATGMKSDDVDSATMESIRENLLKGDREAAVWAAVDKRLWGHAMLIANTTSPELYSRVAQEFVRKEVNYTGHSNESLGAFYKVISGNFEDCVDELIPSHARAGLQLMSTDAGMGSTQDVMSGLDKWRETVSLVLSNRSDNDVRGLNALGKLLSGYGRAEAAQICFIFSRGISVFGGIDDPNADFVLVGADHHKQTDQFAKETEALQLSEVYEYGLTLSGAANLAAGAPHLAGYKLQHAAILAEHGHRDKALQYCDAILTSISAQTRRSPYHHVVLEAAVDDFMRRLKQAPKDDGSSWMSKPSMNKVSDSMWNRFNKFVSGDEDANAQGADGEHGPFARIATTPNISRSPSTTNFETYGASPSYGAPSMMPAQASAATSRYAPATTPAAAPTQNPYELMSQQPAQTNGRTSNEYSPSPYEPAYSSGNNDSGYPGFQQNTESSYQPSQPAPSSYQPQAPSTSTQAYGLQPSPSITAEAAMNANYGYQGYQPPSYEPAPPAAESAGDAAEGGYQPQSTQSFGYEPPTQSFGYEPPSTQSQGYEPPSTQSQGYEPPAMGSQGYEPPATGSQGYEPPSTQSYGYEPPSYQPGLNNDAEDEDAPKPKKKSFMDDDEDDIPALKPADSKSKSELDRENEEMFKKVAEEEGMLRCSTPNNVMMLTCEQPREQRKPQRQRRQAVGALAAGSVAARRQISLPAKRHQTRPSKRSLASPTALFTTLT